MGVCASRTAIAPGLKPGPDAASTPRTSAFSTPSATPNVSPAFVRLGTPASVLPNGWRAPLAAPVAGPSEDIEEPNATSTAAKVVARAPPLDLADLEFVAKLGSGGNGEIMLMQRKVDGRPLALKVIDRERSSAAEDRQHLLAERRLLEQLSHPFLVDFLGAAKDGKRLFLGMECVGGGDLQSYLQARRVLSPPEQQLILGSVAVCLGFLHARGVLFRDLKKENLMVSHDGYLKLVDFGLAKEVGATPSARTYTFCGSITSMAPERFDSDYGHSFACDWWSLGILAFECMYSQTPYRMLGGAPAASEAVDAVAEVIEKVVDEEFMPNLLNEMEAYPGSSPRAIKLMRGLLTFDPDERLAEEQTVRSDAFFSGLDWESMLSRTLPPHLTLKPTPPSYPFELATRMLTAAEGQGDKGGSGPPAAAGVAEGGGDDDDDGASSQEAEQTGAATGAATGEEEAGGDADDACKLFQDAPYDCAGQWDEDW